MPRPLFIKLALTLCVSLRLVGLAAADTNAGVRLLSEFGPLTTPAQADAALERAAQEAVSLVIVPTNAPANWTPRNISQGVWRKPPAPAPALTWGTGPGLTVFDYRDGTAKLFVPELTGLVLARTFALPAGQSAGESAIHPMLSLQNNIVRGSASYREWLLEAVQAGSNRRCYVRTIRGLFPGEFLNIGDSAKAGHLHVKTLGYDIVRKLPYFVADVNQDVPAATLLHNKTHANLLQLDTYSITENQTFDFWNWRHAYSQGDAYLFDGRFDYMGDVQSTSGDANSVIYGAFSISEIAPFRGKTLAWNAPALELKFSATEHAETLASGRPLINLNPQKTITNGTAYITLPGGATLGWYGGIRSTDAPWTEATVVGRYFAIDEPSEYVPGSDKVRRWFQILTFSEKAGVKMLGVQRFWWGAKGGSITALYDDHNYSANEANPNRLHYIIAPGANVFDVARSATEQLVRLDPGATLGTPVDFAAGDPIEQAIGPDPFTPIPFRSWLFDKVPGAFPAPIFDVANHGAVARYSVLTVQGDSDNVAEITNRANHLPPWGSIIHVSALAGNGVVYNADTLDAALTFAQPHGRAQPITWKFYPGGGKGFRTTSLTVSPADGTLKFDGGGLAASGGFPSVPGLSGTATPAHNLRGIKLLVPARVTSLVVPFPTPETTADYAVLVQPSWPTAHAISQQTKTGFTVQLEDPAPFGGTLNWLILR